VFQFFRGRRFALDFVPDEQIERNVTLFQVPTMQPLPDRANYVHVRVRCVGGKGIADCAGWITSLERLDHGRTVARLTGSRPLIWAPREHGITHAQIQPNIPQDLNIFRTVQNVNTLELLSVGHQQSWVTFFSAPAPIG